MAGQLSTFLVGKAVEGLRPVEVNGSGPADVEAVLAACEAAGETFNVHLYDPEGLSRHWHHNLKTTPRPSRSAAAATTFTFSVWLGFEGVTIPVSEDSGPSEPTEVSGGVLVFPAANGHGLHYLWGPRFVFR